jgi:hypothetical protein
MQENTITKNLPMMMLATGITATAGMLPVLANTTVTVGNMTSQLPGLLLSGGHFTICRTPIICTEDKTGCYITFPGSFLSFSVN